MAYDPNQGPGPAQPDGSGGGLPPELQAILSAGGAGGAPAPDPSQDPSADPSADSAPQDFLACLRKMVDDGQQCLDLAPDEQTKQRVMKLVAALHAELATDEKQTDDMLAGKASPSAMRSALSG